MPIKTQATTVTTNAAPIATGTGQGEVVISTAADILVGNATTQDFPIKANATTTDRNCLPLSYGEVLYAKTASSTSAVVTYVSWA